MTNSTNHPLIAQYVSKTTEKLHEDSDIRYKLIFLIISEVILIIFAIIYDYGIRNDRFSISGMLDAYLIRAVLIIVIIIAALFLLEQIFDYQKNRRQIDSLIDMMAKLSGKSKERIYKITSVNVHGVLSETNVNLGASTDDFGLL